MLTKPIPIAAWSAGLALSLLATAACHDATGVERSADVRIRVTAPVANAIAGLTVEVSAPDMDTLYTNLASEGGDQWTGAIAVPVGAGRKFVVRAYEDALGAVSHKGETTIDVREDGAAISILVAPVTGRVDIGGTIGSYSISVTPSVATVSLSGTVTTTVSATITDQAATPVSGPVAWAVQNPGIASITASGNSITVTGLVAGTTRVFATFEGFAGSALITVDP